MMYRFRFPIMVVAMVTGAALAVELLEARSTLEAHVRRLERLVHE